MTEANCNACIQYSTTTLNHNNYYVLSSFFFVLVFIIKQCNRGEIASRRFSQSFYKVT